MIALAVPIRAGTWEARLNVETSADRTELFVALAGRKLDRAYRLAGLLLGNAAEAEDAVGDTLERAWARFGQLRNTDDFDPWFDRILVNGCRDRLRRRQRVRFIPIEPAHDRAGTDDPFRRIVDQDEVLRAMSALPEDERLVVVLHYWADLTLDAVAQRLGWPIGTVKSRLHRALGRMRPAGDSSSAEVIR